MKRVLAPLLLAVLVAGCLQPETAAPTESPGLVIDANRPDTAFGEIVTGPTVGPDLNATTKIPPRLALGEWWRIKFSGNFIVDTPEVVRVVADVSPEGYIIGMPHEGWYKEAIAYHAPAFGDVGLDLSYNTHNLRFEPVRFPLLAGNTWETTFATGKLVATVLEADEVTAKIRLEPPAGNPGPEDVAMNALLAAAGLAGDSSMTLTYDARQHEIVKMESFIGTWEVVAHGYDFEGWVTVPRGEHTAIDYGTFWPGGPEQPIQTRTINVEGGYNRLTMMHLIAPLGPGQYRLTSLAPDAKEMRTESSGAFAIKFYEDSEPNGDWRTEDYVAGAAATYSMGIAYHQYDIQLPDGQRRADHNHAVIR